MLNELISFVWFLRSCLTELNLSSVEKGQGVCGVGGEEENKKYELLAIITKSCVFIMREGWKLLHHAEQPGAAFVALIWQKVYRTFQWG